MIPPGEIHVEGAFAGPMKALTRDTANAVVAKLCAEYGMLVAVKAGPIATIVGAGFDVARAFGASVPSGASFNGDFATTLPLFPVRGLPRGLVLVPPLALENPADHLRRFAHEAKHCDQYTRPEPGESALAWGIRYVSDSRFRASQEAGGYLADSAISWALGEPMRPAHEVAHAVTNNYALNREDLRLVEDLMLLDQASIMEGIVRDEVSRKVIRWLYELQPDCLTPEARALADREVSA